MAWRTIHSLLTNLLAAELIKQRTDTHNLDQIE